MEDTVSSNLESKQDGSPGKDSGIRERLLAALESGISDDAMKAVKKQVDGIIYDIEIDLRYRIKEDLAPHLTAYAVEMAERTVNAILEGNQQQMEHYLGCERGRWTGRSTEDIAWRNKALDEWHPVIHGKLFESGSMRLRRDIVIAHRDLITSQRILDLEDQVKALVAQNNKKTDEIERMRGQRL